MAEENKYKYEPGSDWKQWAGVLGGGAGAYLLAKSLMGDDEIDENGKKKKKGFLKSIVPWLAAMAGGVGGSYLASGIASPVKPGKKGGVAVKVNDDGTVSLPDVKDMPTGTVPYYAAGASGAGAVGFGARGLANLWATKPERLIRSAFDLQNEGFTRGVISNRFSPDYPHFVGPGIYARNRREGEDLLRRIGERLSEANTIRLERDAARTSANPLKKLWLNTREGAGRNLRRGLNWKGNFATAGSLAALSGALGAWGHHRNAELERLGDAIKALESNNYIKQ